MPNAVTCRVDSAGASVQAADTPDNPVYLVLTDVAGSFRKGLFYAADAMKSQMLAVALTAVATGCQVFAFVDPPDTSGGRPHPAQCYELDIIVD